MRKHIDRYDLYQRIKNRTETLVKKLMINKVLERSWIYLIIDFITKLLLVARNNVILVVCDRLSIIAYFVAVLELKTINLVYFVFISHFYFIFYLFFIIDLELRVSIILQTITHVTVTVI